MIPFEGLVDGKAPVAVGPFGDEGEEVRGLFPEEAGDLFPRVVLILGICGFGGGVAVDDELVIGVLAVDIVIGGLVFAGRSGAVGTAVASFLVVVLNCLETAAWARGGIMVIVVVCVMAMGMSMASCGGGGGAAPPSVFVGTANFGLTDTSFPLASDVDDGPRIPIPFGRAATPGSYQGF